MKKNKFFQIFGLIFLVYLSVTGQYLSNPNYKDDALLIGLFIIIVLSIEMMIVPFIVRLFNKERLDIKKGKLICSWNSIIAFILSFALLDVAEELGISVVGVGGIGAIIYYYINKWLFVHNEDTLKEKKKKMLKKQIDDNFSNILEESNNLLDEDFSDLVRCEKRKIRFCKLCGGKLDINNKCKKCGKQYFKFNRIIFLYIIIIILIIICVFLILALDDANKTIDNIYDAENRWCDTQLNSLIGNNDINYIKNKLDFIDNKIVFVLEGDNTYYYTYDCVQTLTNGNHYKFLAFNEESAKSKGYKKGICY